MVDYKLHSGCDKKGYRMLRLSIFDSQSKKNNYFYVCPNCQFIIADGKKTKGVITVKWNPASFIEI